MPGPDPVRVRPADEWWAGRPATAEEYLRTPFWLQPDWSLGENLRDPWVSGPFWMLPPKVEGRVYAEADPKDDDGHVCNNCGAPWFSNDGHCHLCRRGHIKQKHVRASCSNCFKVDTGPYDTKGRCEACWKRADLGDRGSWRMSIGEEGEARIIARERLKDCRTSLLCRIVGVHVGLEVYPEFSPHNWWARCGRCKVVTTFRVSPLACSVCDAALTTELEAADGQCYQCERHWR